MKTELEKTLQLAEDLARRLKLHSERNEMNKGVAATNINYANGIAWTIKRELEGHKTEKLNLDQDDVRLSEKQINFRKAKKLGRE